MAICNRERVLDPDHQLVFGHDPRTINVAEDATVRSLAISSRHAAKISRIAVTLHCVAGVAVCLKVGEIVGAGHVPRNDVIDLKGAIFGPERSGDLRNRRFRTLSINARNMTGW
jgi:hypothetical protein